MKSASIMALKSTLSLSNFELIDFPAGNVNSFNKPCKSFLLTFVPDELRTGKFPDSADLYPGLIPIEYLLVPNERIQEIPKMIISQLINNVLRLNMIKLATPVERWLIIWGSVKKRNT